MKRENLNDGASLLELLGFSSVSVINCTLFALAIDQMVPNNETIEKIIKICWDIQKHNDRIGIEYGTTDSRKYLTIACANWDKKLTESFLNHCIETSTHLSSLNNEVRDIHLAEVCENSLKEKYSKAYLLY